MEAEFLGSKLAISILQLFAGLQFTYLYCGDGHSVPAKAVRILTVAIKIKGFNLQKEVIWVCSLLSFQH